MICENCSKNHNGSYGSGRFCSIKCARSFSTKNKRHEINKKVSEKLKGRVGTNNWTKETLKKVRKKYKQKSEKYMMETLFEELGWGLKRKRIIKEQNNCCNKCGIGSWLDSPIVLEIDHINGNNTDDRRDNLEGLCPNCHSITESWRGRNKPSKHIKKKISDEELKIALAETSSIRQALLSVGMAAKGANYERAKKLLRL
jgi:hypothetical protein